MNNAETKTVKKVDLLSIAELNSEKIRNMTEVQLQSYTKSLKSFSLIFPIQKGQLESAFRVKDYATVLQCLKSIEYTLQQLHADKLANDCKKQISLYHDLDHIRHDKLGIFVDYFSSNFNLFFSDIQTLLEGLELEEVENKQEKLSSKIKEKLSSITDLDSKKIEQMTDGGLNAFIENLIAFNEDFPAQEAGLRSSVKIKQYSSVARWLTAIEQSLNKIHAVSLMEDCQNHIELIKDINNIRQEKLEVFIDYFLSSLSMLSADIKKMNLPVINQIIKRLV